MRSGNSRLNTIRARPHVTSILVNFNSRPGIDEAVASLLDQDVDGPHHIVVWENGIDREVAGAGVGETREVNGKRLCHAGGGVNLGYAGGIGAAWASVAEKGSAFVHLANPDTVATGSSVLRALVEAAAEHHGLAGPAMSWADGTPRPSAYPLMRPYNVWTQQVSRGWMTRLTRFRGWGPARSTGTLDGAYLVADGKAWERLDGLDAGYFLYNDDHDLCIRAAREGIDRWYEPGVQVLHHGATSRVSRRFLCVLEEIRCGLRFTAKFHGHDAERRVRRMLALALDAQFRRPSHRALAWWAREAPTSLPIDDAGIETAYLRWFAGRNHPEAAVLRLALANEVGG